MQQKSLHTQFFPILPTKAWNRRKAPGFRKGMDRSKSFALIYSIKCYICVLTSGIVLCHSGGTNAKLKSSYSPRKGNNIEAGVSSRGRLEPSV